MKSGGETVIKRRMLWREIEDKIDHYYHENQKTPKQTISVTDFQ